MITFRRKKSPYMKRYKQTHTRHWVYAATFIGMAAWLTYALTAKIGMHEDWSFSSLEKYFPKIERSEETDFSPLNSEHTPTALQLFQPEGSINTETTILGESATNVVAASPMPEEPAAFPHLVEHKVRRGDSLDRIFKAQGFDRTLPFLISKDPIAKALSKIGIGRTIEFHLDADKQLRQIVYPTTPLEQLIVNVDGAAISEAIIVPLVYDVVLQQKSGEITTSLYDAALDSGVSITHIMDMVRIFGWDIDFVLDIRQGDSFHMIYEDYSIDGEKIADGALLAAEFTTQGNTFRAIRFDNGDDDISYFAPNGESMLGTFLRSPVEFSRISSRFGQRKHPILKTWRAHNGVDYAAARGTPIRSTAEGKVIHAGTKGGYGNTVIVSHAGRFSTLYAHMTGFAKNIKRGARVQQGQVVGYIGSTGLATGPHLHYEFRLDGVHRNPLTFKTPKATAVSDERRSEFDESASTFGQQLDQLKLSFTQDYNAVALGSATEPSLESSPELDLGNGVGAE